MKNLLLFIILILLSGKLFAQTGNKSPATLPLPFREVSGIVKDSTDNTVIGANVTLISKKDTLRGATNTDGIFVFKNVKLATFVITITGIGYITSVRKYLNNDVVKKIVLDPIILKSQSNMLKEVSINGTPSIIYKTDTVEYKASDYKVRENATVDELLKKMEGMEVGSDGSLTHQGQPVTKARLNGKDYAGGAVAQAIQNLPADIVEKIQIVDDYGDQAARTGIKNGDPQKVLNITTRADRSVGNMARVAGGAGSNERYNARIFAQRINANQQIGVIGNLANTINGVASNNSNIGGGATNSHVGGAQNISGGSGGTTRSGGPSFSYRDQWSKKVQVNANYNYSFSKVNSINSSTGKEFGTTDVTNESSGISKSQNHNFNFEIEYSIDSANFLRVTPSFSYSGANNSNSFQSSRIGTINQGTIGLSQSSNTTPNYGGIIFYQHIFKKPRRNISLQLSLNNSDQQQNNGQNNHILYRDTNQVLVKDSLVHRIINRGNMTKNYRASITYVEPLSKISQLEFNGQVNYRGYDNKALTYNIDSLGRSAIVDSLSNIYKYSFTETRLALNYRLNETKYNISLGLTAVPSLLEGTKLSTNTTTHRTSFDLIPIARFEYAWSRTERFSVNYSGSPTEPTFNQIQPVRDVSNPQNPIVGNPNLKPSFSHSINTQYNNYMANSKLNLSANINTTFVDNQVVTNTVRISDAYKSFKNETHYENLDGTYAVSGNYNIAKQLNDRKYNLALNGSIGYNHNIAMYNNDKYFVTTWRFNERFGPRLNPNESLEINPFVSYDVTRLFNAIPISPNSRTTKTLAFNVDGKIYFLKTFLFGYSASKNYISGIDANISKNPLVVNAYLEKEFFKKRNGILSIQVFDLFNQNNFINRVIADNGNYTDTKTNALSRYVMLSFRLNLQKWSGSPTRKGKQMMRRGDGSFIY